MLADARKGSETGIGTLALSHDDPPGLILTHDPPTSSFWPLDILRSTSSRSGASTGY